jgi:hypothetical protein
MKSASIQCLWLLLLSFSASAGAIARCPSLQVALFPTQASGQNASLTLSRVEVADPHGRVTWSCEPASVGKDSRSSRVCRAPIGWCRSPGNYRLTLSTRSQDGQILPLSPLSFPFSGGERSFEARAHLATLDTIGDRPFLVLHLYRVLPTPERVSLAPAWQPAPDGQPAYFLVNGTSRTFHGTAWFDNYFGWVERRIGARWEPYSRGGFCGTVAVGKPLPPGGKAISFEGAFIGEPEIFAPGLYRYSVRFAPAPVTRGYQLEELRAQGSYLRTFDVYEIRAPFVVAALKPSGSGRARWRCRSSEQVVEELLRPFWAGERKPDRTLARLAAQVELEEGAAGPLGPDQAEGQLQRALRGRQEEAVSVGLRRDHEGLGDQPADQPLLPGAELGRSERAGDGEHVHRPLYGNTPSNAVALRTVPNDSQ